MRSLATILIFLFSGTMQIWAQKNTPDEKSIVKKEYDENGNLFQYNSTYVWQWNSDSTMNFSFDNNLAFGKEFPGFFGESDADSIFEKFGFSNKDGLMPLNDEDIFKQFQHSFPDSMNVNGLPFEADSTFTSHFDFQFPGNIDLNELEKLHKQFQEQFNQRGFSAPEFSSPEQQEEWDKLMKKQQKEKEELFNKWEGKKL